MENGELSSYQLMIQRNIEENKRVLQSLGFSFGTQYQPKEKLTKPRFVRKSVPKSKERQSIDQVHSRPTRIQTRRSSSILETIVLDNSEISSDVNNDEENIPPQKKQRCEPVFGEIEGIRVGDWWPSRLDCSAAGVHRPTVAGIHAKQGEGCYSIALSGGYEDDIDCGTYFTYTGSGGRDLKGTKCKPKNLRTAPQSKDQVFEGVNAALACNIESNKPVRVIRGFKLQSDFAPEEGYRYDGLYSVEKYWTATGLSGFKVIKYALKRLQAQDPPPWKSCIQSKPSPSKELPPAEINIPTQIDTSKSISPFKSSPSKLSTRARPRKQCCPKQYCQNNFNKYINSVDFSITTSTQQTTILNYFSPIKKVVKNNHFTSILISPSNYIPSSSFTSGASAINGPTNSDSNLIGSPENTNRSSSHKRKYSSSFTKHKLDLDLFTLCERSPSMMENLIKQKNEKLKLYKQITQKKRKCSQENVVKPFSVTLQRIKIQDFNQCWDLARGQFLGFGETELNQIKIKRDKFRSSSMMENLYKQITQKKRKCCQEHLVKPCSVTLRRIKIQDFNQRNNVGNNNQRNNMVFLGWDLAGGQFLGFSETELNQIKIKRDKFRQSINNIFSTPEKDTPEKNVGFCGWDVNIGNFQGASGLVPLGFIIDKLSKS